MLLCAEGALRPGHRYALLAFRAAAGGFAALAVIGACLPMWTTQLSAAERAATLPKPGQASEVSRGGRLYDNHWSEIGRRPPTQRNPAYPTDQTADGLTTWRCVACHGWDYLGGAGHLDANVSPFSSIRSAAGRDPKDIAKFLKTSTDHAMVLTGLPAGELEDLALFVCCGQHDIGVLIDENGKAKGDPLRGKDIFENSCARCHQADGQAPLYGEEGDVSSLGWIARERPAQAVHKIRNGVPNADMLSLRFLELERIGDLLAYVQTLD